ncbi:MAG TPA: helix-turn-helix domain-containing protein [Moraxellaceae bacterium]|nr:helix-turn-helix domain-containing protein [Moraxellaceae bacterium]
MSTKAKIKKAVSLEEEGLRENEKKWGKELIAAGWTAVPNIIIKRQKQLGLEALDLNIILHLMSYWWKAGELPFPSKKTLAEAMSVNESTIRRRIARLEAGSLVKRIERRVDGNRNKTNQYDFSGLIEAVKPFAVEELSAIEAARQEKAERTKRMRAKKPALKAVE